MGNHPEHMRVDPSTAQTCLWHGVRVDFATFRAWRCWGPTKQMLAPLSGKTFIVVDEALFCVVTMRSISISVTVVGWVNSPLVWSNDTWAASDFTDSWIFLRQTLGVLQLLQFFPHAGHFADRSLEVYDKLSQPVQGVGFAWNLVCLLYCDVLAAITLDGFAFFVKIVFISSNNLSSVKMRKLGIVLIILFWVVSSHVLYSNDWICCGGTPAIFL